MSADFKLCQMLKTTRKHRKKLMQVSIDSEINISDDILLAVAMNGLKPELKTIVMTKVPNQPIGYPP
jgi:hypothetical protein